MPDSSSYTLHQIPIFERLATSKTILLAGVSVLEGEYGDAHKTTRTRGSELWINPLMTIFWCFELDSVVKKIKYYNRIQSVNSIAEFNTQLTYY